MSELRFYCFFMFYYRQLSRNMTEVAMPLDTTNKLQGDKMQEDNITTNVEKVKDTTDEQETDSKVFIHTGNIANWTNLKTRKTNDIPANELFQSLSRSLNKWSTNGNASKLQNSHEIHINCSNAEKLDENERGLLKITAKIFLQKQKVESIQQAMDFIMKQLGITYVDSLYIALPPWDETENFADVILPYWEELERLNDAGFAKQISSCDLDQVKLQSLVEMVRTKPEVNQVNLASCCHMPEELVTYAKRKSVSMCKKCPYSELLGSVFSRIRKYLPVFSPNARKCGPE